MQTSCTRYECVPLTRTNTARPSAAAKVVVTKALRHEEEFGLHGYETAEIAWNAAELAKGEQET